MKCFVCGREDEVYKIGDGIGDVVVAAVELAGSLYGEGGFCKGCKDSFWRGFKFGDIFARGPQK